MIAGAWLAAYALRFGGWPLPVYRRASITGIPPPGRVYPAHLGAIFKGMRMFRRRVLSHLREVWAIF